MEDLGIGRPATYAATLDVLKDRGYIALDKKSIEVTDLGIRVCDFLVAANFCFIDLQFTAALEGSLDQIANAEKQKLSVLTEFWTRLKSDLTNAKSAKEKASLTDYPCPYCKKNGVDAKLLKKFSKFGPFFSCSNYSNKTNPCKFIGQVGENGEPVEKVKKEKVYSEYKCPLCKSKMVVREGKYGSFMGCEKFPKCRGIRDKDGAEIQPKKKFYKKHKSY
jgi:DNA topoisomerase-1